MSRRKSIKQFQDVRDWANERGLYLGGDTKTQMIKLVEEVGEISRAIIKNKPEDFKDGIGDAMVVLINLAHLGGFSAEECLAAAWDQIKDRKGNMQNGSFVKNG